MKIISIELPSFLFLRKFDEFSIRMNLKVRGFSFKLRQIRVLNFEWTCYFQKCFCKKIFHMEMLHLSTRKLNSSCYVWLIESVCDPTVQNSKYLFEKKNQICLFKGKSVTGHLFLALVVWTFFVFFFFCFGGPKKNFPKYHGWKRIVWRNRGSRFRLA